MEQHSNGIVPFTDCRNDTMRSLFSTLLMMQLHTWSTGSMRAAVVSLGQHLLIHAGVVASGWRGILLPGASGAGKSTLVASTLPVGLHISFR